MLAMLGLLAGCAVLERTLTGLVPMSAEVAPADPMYLHLQLSMLSDAVVSQMVQLTKGPLANADDARQRERLLRLRLDYASALWNAAAGANPRANAVNVMFILALGRAELRQPRLAAALGPIVPSIEEFLAGAENDAEALVRGFLGASEFETLRAAIDHEADSPAAQRSITAVDLPGLLEAADSSARASGRSTNLFRMLGVDPFAGLDPATREIAESRQFGERLLFSLQRMPTLLRLNSELLVNDVARDLDLERIVDGLERASTAMADAAAVAAEFPDRLSAERAQVLAGIRSEADRLGVLAHDYRAAFDAANAMAASTNETLRTFATVVDRFGPRDDAGGTPSRPFDVNEYSHAAATIGETAANLSLLLEQFDSTLGSPALATLSPAMVAALDEADARGRRVLYLAFALGCALIAVASLATIVTAAVLRRQRDVGGRG